jgi:acyl-homoserine lactone acylase PvdQ
MMRQTLLLCLILLACTPPKAGKEQVRWKEQAARVTLIRDDFGIPHIYGKSDADAVFGLLYAQCEDDFPRVENNYLMAIGRLAEVEGESALYNDLRANLYMTREEAQQQYADAPEWLKALCVAFADGINYYLHTHPEVKPRLLTRFEPWMPLYFFEGSIGGDIESISTAKLRGLYESLPPDEKVKSDSLVEPQGSNGFAISGSLTQSGEAMLLINPHTSFYFRGEAHVVSEEGLNVYGAVTWGQFFVYQGFNEHNGWMHTSSGADVMDQFVEKVDTLDGRLVYSYGEERREVKLQDIQLYYASADGLKKRTFTIYRTHHGPITHGHEGRWISTAMNWNPVKALEQSYLRTKTKTYAEFLKLMDLRTNSSNNTVYADNQNNIAYFHGNFMPRRDTTFDYSKPVDGSDPRTDWQGLHEVQETIWLLNPANGWIQNCNSTPFTAALEHSPDPDRYPRYMAPEPDNFRGLHAVRVLTGRTGYTLDTLIKIAYDPYLPAFELLIPGLVSAFDHQPGRNPKLKPAIDTLRTWNKKVRMNSVAMTLAHFYLSHYVQHGKYPEGMHLMDRINYYGVSSPPEERIQIFSEVMDKLTTDFGTWNLPWGEVNRLQRLDGNIRQAFNDSLPSLPVGMASGNWGALASFGSRSVSRTKRIYGTYGNSFVAVVSFGDKVKAKTLLAGGQSSHPDSPHFFDQGQRYAEGIFKEVAFYYEDVMRRTQRQYHPGE